MAEGRMLKKRISQSHKFAALKSHNAQLLYIMLIPHLDIKGRFEADPKIIKGVVVPLLNFSLQKIWEYEEDMHTVGLVKLYKVNGQWYLEAIKFSDFQTLRESHEAKSQCPEPTTGELQELVGPIKVKESKVKESKVKKRFLNFVFLTEEEHQKLIKRYGQKAISSLIEDLNTYVGSKGVRYKSHYFALLNFAKRDNLKELHTSAQQKRREIIQEEHYKQQQREDKGDYLRKKSAAALQDLRKDPGIIPVWLIDEILKSRSK